MHCAIQVDNLKKVVIASLCDFSLKCSKVSFVYYAHPCLLSEQENSHKSMNESEYSSAQWVFHLLGAVWTSIHSCYFILLLLYIIISQLCFIGVSTKHDSHGHIFKGWQVCHFTLSDVSCRFKWCSWFPHGSLAPSCVWKGIMDSVWNIWSFIGHFQLMIFMQSHFRGTLTKIISERHNVLKVSMKK